jgi:predicted transglutaminase-like cysteine proteinase
MAAKQRCAAMALRPATASVSAFLGVLLLLACDGIPQAAATERNPDFTSQARVNRGVTLSSARMPKWQAMYARHRASSSSSKWRGIVSEARGNGSGKLLRTVNSIVIQARYVPDRGGDIWAAPSELFSRGGDCEDFAIAKFLLLKELGFPSSSMRVLITRNHAVLAVDTDGTTVILDNRRSAPYAAGSGTISGTVFALNDRDWWVNTRSRTIAQR